EPSLPERDEAARKPPAGSRRRRPEPVPRLPPAGPRAVRAVRAGQPERLSNGLPRARRRPPERLPPELVPSPAAAAAERRDGVHPGANGGVGESADADPRRHLLAAADPLPQRSAGAADDCCGRLSCDSYADRALL